MEEAALYERLDSDALFFSFYFQQCTPQQQFAARELKRANWRREPFTLTQSLLTPPSSFAPSRTRVPRVPLPPPGTT